MAKHDGEVPMSDAQRDEITFPTNRGSYIPKRLRRRLLKIFAKKRRPPAEARYPCIGTSKGSFAD